MNPINKQARWLMGIILFLLTGCKLMSVPEEQSDSGSRLVSNIESQLHSNPQQVLAEVDSVLPLVADSVVHYQLLLIKAKSMFLTNKLEVMRKQLDQLLDFCTRNPEITAKSNLPSSIYNTYGNYFTRYALMDSANIYYHKAFDAAQKAEKCELLPDLAINLADSYVRSGKFDLGSFWYWKSLALSDSIQVPEEKRFPSYFGLAQVHMELQDFAACDSFYEKAGKNFSRMLPFEKHIYLNNRGNSYYFRKDYKTALDYFRRSLKVVKSQPHLEFERHLTELNMGEVFLLLNETDSSSYYLNSCLDFFKASGNQTALYYIDTQLIGLAIQQKNMALAGKRIAEAVKPSFVEPGMLNIRNRYLQNYYEGIGDYKRAYLIQTQNKRMDDSIRNEKVKMRNSELALKYQLDNELMKKEILIRRQDNEMLRLNQWIYSLVSGALIMAAFIWVFFLYRSRKNEKKLWNMKTAINSLRLENVRNRISPHFIFNILNHEMSRFRDEEDKTYLITLVQMIRKHLQLTDQVKISLNDELDFVKSFLRLEKSSLGDNFEFKLNLDGKVDLNSFYIPSMSIYNLVENAVKHSLLLKEGKRNLWLSILAVDDRVEIRLCDNGGGFKLDSPKMGTGTGFKVITQTIQLYNQYNKKPIYMKIHNINVEGGEVGCEVTYSIPKDYTFTIKS